MISPEVSLEASATVRDGMLWIGCWQIGPELPDIAPHDFDVIARFASGEPADNKVIADLPLAPYAEYANQVPPAQRVSIQELNSVSLRISQVYDSMLDAYPVLPDTLWGVPSGGQNYARLRAQRSGLRYVELAKVENLPGKKTYRPASDMDADALAAAKVMVASEDAGTEGTSLYGAMYESDAYGLSALREKTAGIDFVWIRGALGRLQGLELPMQTIVHELVPNRITKSHPFYRRFGRLAVPHPALS